MNSFLKNIIFWVVVVFAIVIVYRLYSQTQPRPDELTFSQFLSQVEAGEIREVIIRGQELEGKYTTLDNSGQPRTFTTFAPDYDDLVNELRKNQVAINAKKPRESTYLIRDVVRQLLEDVRARDEIRLAVDLHDHADPAAMDVRLDQALADLALGSLGGLRQPLFAQQLDRLFDVALGLA